MYALHCIPASDHTFAIVAVILFKVKGFCESITRAPYLGDGFGSRHAGQPHVVLGLPAQDIKFLPVDFHLERVVLDLFGRLGFADLVGKVPLLGCLRHLQRRWVSALVIGRRRSVSSDTAPQLAFV